MKTPLEFAREVAASWFADQPKGSPVHTSIIPYIERAIIDAERRGAAREKDSAG